MLANEILDSVLQFISEKTNKGGNTDNWAVQKLLQSQKFAREIEVVQIMEKLFDDKYITIENIKSEQYQANPRGRIITITNRLRTTFKGDYFLQNGGYGGEEAKRLADSIRLEAAENSAMANRNATLLLSFFVAVGTLVAAVYYVQEVLKNHLTPCAPVQDIILSFLAGAIAALAIWIPLTAYRKRKRALGGERK